MVDSQIHTRGSRRPSGAALLAAAALAFAWLGTSVVVAAEAGPAAAAEHGGAHGEAEHVDWQAWKAGNQIGDKASLQRGAANFANYCASCHSIKYLRYERMAKDLHISDELLRKTLLPAGAKPTDYMMASVAAADGEAWFGRAPPDLSLITRSKGSDYVYQFLKGFYVDDTRITRSNNLALPGAAMPAVLSDLEGVKAVVFAAGGDAGHGGGIPVQRFEQVAPGALTAAQYDSFVRDTVNYLDYAGEPSQIERGDLGIWVLLFLLMFTGLAWMLKKEYWRDVH